MKDLTVKHQLACEDISLAYDGRTVLEHTSFSVDAGDYLCIVGENGSGKSTLIKALLSLKRPSAGRIVFGGGLKRGQVGYLPQQTNIQNSFPAKVSEVVLSGCLGRGAFRPFYTASDKKRASEMMEKLGIKNIEGSLYRSLSGGQKQRVLLARALCAADKMLLLDEPVSGLDPIAAKEMYSLIKALNEKEGMTVIMVSHDISEVMKHASKILHLDHGVTFFGTKEEYISSSCFLSLERGGNADGDN